MADPWVPSHAALGRHPKCRRAARLAGCSVPAMIGHLHLLWHWALTIAPDGDLSRFDPDDIADAAMWDGDPDTFVHALIDCGPGDSAGFLEESFALHDWADYGGRYHKRSQAGKAAAAARWSTDPTPSDLQSDANAMRSHVRPQSVRNADKRRGDKNTTTRGSRKAPPEGFDAFWSAWRRKVARQDAERAFAKAMTGTNAPTLELLLERVRAQLAAWDAERRAIDKHPHASTWLNGRRWEDDALTQPISLRGRQVQPDPDDPYAGVVFR